MRIKTLQSRSKLQAQQWKQHWESSNVSWKFLNQSSRRFLPSLAGAIEIPLEWGFSLLFSPEDDGIVNRAVSFSSDGHTDRVMFFLIQSRISKKIIQEFCNW